MKSSNVNEECSVATGVVTEPMVAVNIEPKGPVFLLLCDLDHFKSLNDQFGHHVGDKIFCAVATILKQQCDHPAYIGHLGGEEFCPVIPNTTQAEVTSILSRVRKAVEPTEYNSVQNVLVPLTLSIGAVTVRADDSRYTDLLDRASGQALIAKRIGRNQLCCAD